MLLFKWTHLHEWNLLDIFFTHKGFAIRATLCIMALEFFDGSYRCVIWLKEATAKSETIWISTREGSFFVHLSTPHYFPNGNGLIAYFISQQGRRMVPGIAPAARGGRGFLIREVAWREELTTFSQELWSRSIFLLPSCSLVPCYMYGAPVMELKSLM